MSGETLNACSPRSEGTDYSVSPASSDNENSDNEQRNSSSGEKSVKPSRQPPLVAPPSDKEEQQKSAAATDDESGKGQGTDSESSPTSAPTNTAASRWGSIEEAAAEIERLTRDNALAKRAYDSLVKKHTKLKDEYRELQYENELAVEQIAVLRIKGIELQSQLDGERTKNEIGQKTMTTNHGSTNAPPSPPHGQQQWAAPRSPNASRLGGAMGSPGSPQHTATVVAAATAAAVAAMDTYNTTVNNSLNCGPSPSHSQLNASTEHHTANRTGSNRYSGGGSVLRPHSTTQHTTTTTTTTTATQPHSSRPRGRTNSIPDSGPRSSSPIVNRLLRSMTPPPSKERMGKLVDSMVKELIKTFKAMSGIELPLKKASPCVYTLGGPTGKRLNLTVVSDRLVVKLGGGHQDLVEYLSRQRKVMAPAQQHHSHNHTHL